MKRRILAWICLFCLLQSSALADLRRGSSGDEVVRLQQQLIDVGALDDTADGKFGPKTEKAVKTLQAYFGQKKTGKADEKFMDELSLLWYTLQEEEVGTGELSEEDMREQHLYCYPTEAEPEYCPRHEFLHYLEGLLKVSGRAAPAGVQCKIYQRIDVLGYREILVMYDLWEERLQDAEKHIAREQKENFISGFEAVFGSISNYESLKPSLFSLNTWKDMYNWVMLTLVNNCYDLNGQEPEEESPAQS